MADGAPSRAPLWALGLCSVAVVLLGIGSYIGLAVAPPDQYMGDVARIMYVHVPTAWNALLQFTLAFGAAIVFLTTRRWGADSVLEASLELGTLLAFLLCCQGSIWAKPTWNVWWDWDPRLTTTAVMLFAFLGILALRRFVEDPVKRATWSAVATIVAYADVPIVYFSVKWWNSLHQPWSSPKTVDAAMVTPLRINAIGILLLAAGLVVLRAHLATLRRKQELAPPPAAAPAAAQAAPVAEVRA